VNNIKSSLLKKGKLNLLVIIFVGREIYGMGDLG